MKKLLCLIFMAMFCFGVSAMADLPVVSANHFEGGKNLYKGNKLTKDSKHLGEIVQSLQLESNKLQVYTSAVGVSGDSTPTVVVTGLGASDTILSVTQSANGVSNLPLLGWSNQLANSLDLVYSADPGNGFIVKVLVKKP